MLPQWCRWVFYYEGWLLFASGAAMLLAPEQVMAAQGFSATAAAEPLACCNLRQFGEFEADFFQSIMTFISCSNCPGAMCILMGFVGVFADVYRRIVMACLLGDVVWMAAFLPTVIRLQPL